MNAVWRVLQELLYPPKCIFCRSLLDEGLPERICPQCRKSLPLCHQVRSFQFVASCHVVLYYERTVRDAILRYKFQDAAHYSRTLGHMLGAMIQTQLDGQYDILTWVPVSRKRLRTRGYDQAQLLAQYAAAVNGKKPERLLRKTRNNVPQSSLQDAGRRRANVQGVYEVLHPERIAGKRILLLDDVVTTGSTMSECARMLLTAGAAAVIGAALATRRDETEQFEVIHDGDL